MKLVQRIGISMIVLFGYTAVNAQVNQVPQQMQQQQQQVTPDISDEELQKFVDAYQEIQLENQKIQQKMIAKIQEEGMEVDRFTQIQQAQQNPDQEADMTAEEEKAIQSLMPKLQTIQQESQSVMQERIENAGLTMTRYQEIAQMVQQSPELQQKLQGMMQG
jgi:thiamine pyrophosphate-dependent acetolactate synthase large subunit-like protein